MNERASRLAFGVLVIITSLMAVTAFMDFSRPPVPGVIPAGPEDLGYLFRSIAFGGAGALVARRQPANRIWVWLSANGLGGALFGFGVQYTIYAVVLHPGSLPGGRAATWVSGWVFTVIPTSAALVLLLFPTGHPVTPRWRFALWLVPVAAAGLAASLAVSPGWPQDVVKGRGGAIQNPLALQGHDQLLTVLFAAAVSLLAVVFVLAIASLVARYRRGDSVERHQLKWFLFVAPFVPLGFVLYPVLVSPSSPASLRAALVLLQIVSSVGLPVALGIAILKYRLYDIDVVISRTLAYGALALFVTAVYVVIVVGIGHAIGATASNPVLSVLATAIVAIAFQPVHQRLRRLGNRVVYGRRATPYEVLTQFSAQVAEALEADEVLPRMARLLGEATGARQARVWVRRQGEMLTAAVWPTALDGGAADATVPITDALMLELPGVDRAAPIRYQGELLGALSVVKRAGDAMTPVEQTLMDDVARQAGLVLRNVGLTAELLQRLDELRASRQRLVAAQDEERRRLERNLHDGAQQNLVALKVKVNLVGMTIDKDPTRARELVEQVKADADDTLRTLRDLARGIYPPLLAQMGLVAALEAQAQKALVPVSVRAASVARYSQDVESTVYFCCLEALQNIQKYAHATGVVVTLGQVEDRLEFAVADDGVGFETATVKRGAGLQNISDRLDAVGGRPLLRSVPGRGTTVGGSLPVPLAVDQSVPA